MDNAIRHLLVLLLLGTSLCAHALESGQTVRLVNNGKSVFVENASLDESKNAVLWTETNVNAQRWTLEATSRGTFLLSNDYSGLYLAGLTSGSSGNVGQMSKSVATSRGSWEFVPIEGTTNQFYIYQNTTRRYALAAATDPADGSKLSLVNTTSSSIDPARITWTVETLEPMPHEFTKDMRDDMMQKWKDRCYRKASTGWVIGGGGFWGDAEMFEIVLDALETTGDQQYATMFENLYTNFIARNGGTWFREGSGYNPFNDDIAWICIACVRAYLLTGTTKYRTTAKTNFDGMFARADCYGNDLLQWKHNEGQGTNSCINGPAAVCACYLAIAQADESYYEKAKKTYLAERGKLFEMSNGKPTGKVLDSYDLASGKYNDWASTYNQGTNLGAAIMLYNHYGDKMYKDDADAIISWTEKNLANSKGIIHVCQNVGDDYCGFKGILLRYIRKYAEDFNAPQHLDWIAKNAYHAWNNRNSSGITSSAWLTKAEEDFMHLEGTEMKSFANEGNMTCVSAAFNCNLGVVLSHDAYAVNQAEDFNYVRNAPVTYEGNEDEGEDGGMVGAMRNNYYIGYRRVDFGDSPASHIELRTKISLGTTGINVYLDKPNAKEGTLLCNIKGNELAALKTWDTIRKQINLPVTGEHDVYFVSSGSGQTYINWWQFHSLNTVYADLTGGNGSLVASFTADDISAITDGDITTACTGSRSSDEETWIQYTSTSPMRLYGYQVFSGSTTAGDPRGWTLLGSNDGKAWETLHTASDIVFSVRGQLYAADIQPQKAYTHYRLLFDCYSTQQSISLSEWQLLGRYICASDLTADGGDITPECAALVDHVGETPLPTPISAVYHTAGNYRLSAYSLTIGSRSTAPTAWKLEGSTNGTTWKPVDEQTDAVFPYDNCTNVYRISPDNTYLFYRLTIASEGAQISQWQLFGTPDYGTFYADVLGISSVKASDGSDCGALTDKNGGTYAEVSGTNPYWEITVPIAVKALGFSLVCADKTELDPKSITLLGYDDEDTPTQLSSKTLTFPARGSRLTYTVSTTKLLKRFLLMVNEATPVKVRLAELEFYGAAIAEMTDGCLLVPGGVEASAVGITSTELINRVHDGSRTTCYRAAFDEPVSIVYSYDDPVSINTYSITASKNEPTRDPADWTLEGSNDGISWTMLDSRQQETFSQRYATQFYPTGQTDAFSTYRLTVSKTAGAAQMQVGELQLLNMKTDPTSISTAAGRREPESVYDLQGRRIANRNLPRGIYIVNGKKILK